jgi:hypothetical protein
MVQKFTGTISTRRIAKVPKIWEVHHETGEYFAGSETPYHSKMSIWVPTPRHGEHLPGIFLRLSNPGGSTYTRMSGDEFAELYTFFRHNHAPAVEAFAKAEARLKIYREAERALLIEGGHDFVDVRDTGADLEASNED